VSGRNTALPKVERRELRNAQSVAAAQAWIDPGSVACCLFNLSQWLQRWVALPSWVLLPMDLIALTRHFNFAGCTAFSLLLQSEHGIPLDCGDGSIIPLNTDG
jgi:hypothetical protein